MATPDHGHTVDVGCNAPAHTVDTDRGHTVDTVDAHHRGHGSRGIDPVSGCPPPADDSLGEVLELLGAKPTWHRDAACREHPELSWFVDRGQDLTEQRAICSRCLARTECATDAINRGERHGLWGGLTTPERQRLRKSSAEEEPWKS